MRDRVAVDGSATHPMVARLIAPNGIHRDMADAIHILGMVHGHHPGLADETLTHNVQPAAAAWLAGVGAAFADERAYLAALVSAAGPIPSTPGQAETEAALAGQHHALHMLAGSARAGCAAGAVLAQMLDWRAIRAVLDHGAARFGLAIAPLSFPHPHETALLVGQLADTLGSDRAMRFGADQLLAQHRGLWNLVEARASARDHL
ncbi:hypothetical protein ASE75_08575 [Sphingomonas sp. Leaf17]|nr:hypothetical protein ASE75_08575 [Sphingomonas sp. Leaf17]